jgi:hypothetical protein
MTARTIPVETFDYFVFGGTGDLSYQRRLITSNEIATSF